MDGTVGSPMIRLINKGVIHRICSGQVILDLSAAVKELVENSLDAGASSIEISLKEYGEESIKVTDNGCGISPNSFQVFITEVAGSLSLLFIYANIIIPAAENRIMR